MYRGRRRNRETSGIQGPNSALTQFLREEGISAENIKQNWLKSQFEGKKESENDAESSNTDIPNSLDTNDNIDNVISLKEEEVYDLKDEINTEPTKLYVDRVKDIGDDSDEEEYDENVVSSSARRVAVQNIKATPIKRKDTAQILKNRRKRRKKAESLLDQDGGNNMPTLQNICLDKISENISSWQKESNNDEKTLFSQLRDKLGGISDQNLNRLSQALSKNRALNDSTLQLFLKTNLEEITFHDCSRISFDGYKTLAIFSPNLRKLSLQMCGQLNNESLLYIAEKLPRLDSLYLDGPFLINEDTWNKFFISMKGRLKQFHVSNTHRFTDNSLLSLLTNCQEVLESLDFARLDSVTNYALLPQYLTNERFHTLGIQYPANEEDVTDEVVINILGQVGSSLRSLTLNGCLELTDSFVINGMAAFLSGKNNSNALLETLNLEGLEDLTTDSLVYYFSQVSLPNLKHCSLKGCIQVGDMAIVELLLNQASQSLTTLNFNSMKSLTKEAFIMITCPNLETIDVGFVRCINDEIVESIGNQNPRLRIMEVFGDNLISDKTSIRQGLTLVGRQSDSI